MKWFDYAAPESLNQAVAFMAAHPGARPLAGGTDLLVQMRSGRKETGYVMDVKRVPELNEIAYDPERGLTLHHGGRQRNRSDHRCSHAHGL